MSLLNPGETIRFVLPLPPTCNNYRAGVAINGKPRLITSRKGREYFKVVKSQVEWDWSPLEDRLAVEIEVRCPTRAKSDLDNRVKPLLDALTQAGVWADDSLIDHLEVRRGPIEKPGGVTVWIKKRGV